MRWGAPSPNKTMPLTVVAVLSMLFFGVGYPPPSQYDILNTLQKRFHGSRGTFLDPVINTDSYELQFNHYPVDAVLQHCDPYLGRIGDGLTSLRFNKNGYRCLVEVIPYAIPAFTLSGIFTFDGYEWIYIGETMPRSMRPQETLNRKDVGGRGRTILKPGSIPYDGNPDDPVNDVRSPYRDLLGVGSQKPPF